ncbi:MAG: creatininase family protein [Longimicrobiales bacterium]|jgi:creatinine amidohydrolase
MNNIRPVVTLFVVAAFAMPLAGQVAFEDEIVMERPMSALNTIWLEEMTWLEIRDAMAEGARTAIVSTGGIEQNGPYVAMGKHNYVLEAACEGIARKLGDALCAPIIKLVPEGDLNPPTGHMRYPGTLTVRQETFEAMLEDVGRSLDQHGFDWIIYIGDSGGNQTGMEAVASRLNAEWGSNKALFIGEFYDNAGVQKHMEDTFGIVEESQGWHDNYWLTAMQASVDPETVRYEQRVRAGNASINGVSLTPLGNTIAVGEELLRWRIDQTVRVIQSRKGM